MNNSLNISPEPILLVPKKCLEEWTSELISSIKERCLERVSIIDEPTQQALAIYRKITSIPQSHHCLEEIENHEPLMHYYFIEFILNCLLTSPITTTQQILINFLKDNQKLIHNFITDPRNRTDAEWHTLDSIFTLKEMHSYIGYIYERSKELTQKLKDRGLKTDLFLNMGTMFHNLYSLYNIYDKKHWKEARSIPAA